MYIHTPKPTQNAFTVLDIHIYCGSNNNPVKAESFTHIHTPKLTPDPFENTFSGTHLYCGSNNNPIVGEFVAALNTSIISGFAFRGLCETDCENDVVALLGSLLWAPDTVHQIPP
jgi:hypothetical protein